jgi:hypothetical protein
VRLAIGHIESFRACSQIAKVGFNLDFQQPAHNLWKDELARLGLCHNFMDYAGIHQFLLYSIGAVLRS